MKRPWGLRGERALVVVPVVPALLAVAWLLPGAGLLVAGRLRPVPMVVIAGAVAVAVCFYGLRQAATGAGSGARAGGRLTGRRAGGALLAMTLVAAGFGVWQAWLRSGQVLGAGDPGLFLQYGWWIAGHGSARVPVQAAAFGGASGLGFTTTGFTLAGGAVTPAYAPGLPLVLAGGAWLGGLGGALLMPAVLGGCALLSFGGLAARLLGPWQGVAAEVALAACLPEVYSARAPSPELLVQVLLFGGLCLLTDSLAARRGGDGAGGGRVLAGLGGLALGLTVLASGDSLSLLLPVFPALAVLFVAGRGQAGALGAGLLAGLAAGLAPVLALAPSALSAAVTRPALAGWAVVTLLAALLAVPGARPRLRRWSARRVALRGPRGRRFTLPSAGGAAQWLALVLPAVVLVVLAERPYLQVVRQHADLVLDGQVAALQRAQGLPVDGARLYYESSLHWVLWYLGAPAVLLGGAGAAALGRRLVQAVLREGPLAAGATVPHAAAGPVKPAAWRWALPLALIAWSVVSVLWDPGTVPWQPEASRRLVPLVLPGFVLLAVWTSSWLASRAARRGASPTGAALAAGCCLLAVAGPGLITTLNPGLAPRPSAGPSSSGLSKLVSRVRWHGVGVSPAYGGVPAAASALCAAVGPSASVLFTDAATADAYGPAVREMCGDPVATVGAAGTPGTSPASSELLGQAAGAVARAGRRAVLLGPTSASVSLAGAVPRQVVSLSTAGDAQALTGAPAGTWPVSYALWLSLPPAAP